MTAHRKLDPSDLKGAAERLDEAAAEAEFISSLTRPIHLELEDADDPRRVLLWPFDYGYVAPDDEGRSMWGSFRPSIEFTDGSTYPPPLHDIAAEHVKAWEALLPYLSDSRLRARLHDVLWEHGVPDKYAHAIRAIDAHLKISTASPPGVVLVSSLQRAGELSRRLRDAGRIAHTARSTAIAAAESMAGDDPKPGVTIRLLRLLVDLPIDVRPAEVEDLLDQAEATYGSSAWHRESILEMRLHISRQSDEREDLERALVQVWIDAAAADEGLGRHTHLTHALDLARRFELPDLVSFVRRELQELEHEDLGLQTIATEIEIPREELERQTEWVAAGSGWAESLHRLVALGPLTGDHKRNLEAVREQRSEGLLINLLPQTVLGPYNVPVFKALTEEEKEELSLSHHEQVSLELWSIMVADALDLILKRHGDPDHEDLSRALTGELVPDYLAERFSRAITLYVNRDFDESVHVILPRIEAAVRNLAQRAGLAVAYEPRGGKPFGGVDQLGGLLSRLEGILTEDWRRHLRALLTHPLGMNLRNNYLHGLIAVASRRHAALLIHAAAFLTMLAPSGASDQPAQDPVDRPPDQASPET